MSITKIETVETETVEINSLKAICDGGDEALGHPTVYLTITPSKSDHIDCPYCGRRYTRKEGTKDVVNTTAEELTKATKTVANVDEVELAIDDETEAQKNDMAPQEYKQKYREKGDPDSCDDDIAKALKEEITSLNEKGEPSTDMTKLKQVAIANGCIDKFEKYEASNLNNGMIRVDIGNVLRAKWKRGEKVTIGKRTL